MGFEVAEEDLGRFFDFLFGHLDEKQRRLLAGSVAGLLGHGGQAAVARASGMSRNTVIDGVRAVEAGEEPADRVRREGGGRPLLEAADPTLLADLLRLIEPGTRGDPISPLRWTLKSTRKLAAALGDMGHRISSWTVAELLRSMGYSLQATSKTTEGAQHADRDGQFAYLNGLAADRLAAGEPVVSVDCKKKELVVGVKANAGREWQPKGDPVRVDVHDFPDPNVPKAIPYGVYDIGADEGWVSVGDDHDTATFAVNAVADWWATMGRARYPEATRLLVTADSGGSNSSRGRLWKVELARLAEETGLEITVCHYPPGTSKWNRVEHRLFSFMTINWRGRPLTSYQAIVELAAATTTRSGLRVMAQHDTRSYPTGVTVTDAQLADVNLVRHEWHGDWNYTITTTARR